MYNKITQTFDSIKAQRSQKHSQEQEGNYSEKIAGI